MNKKILLATTILALGLGSPALAATKDESLAARIQKLEEELQILKRQNEVKEEEAAKAAEKEANVEIGKKGLKITSPDKKYQLGVNGVFQFDNRNFAQEEGANLRDEALVRRARPILSFKAGDALLYFVPDFAGTSANPSNTKIVDAYGEYKFSDAAKVRVGKFKTPVGLEQLQSDPNTMFTERGFASNLTPTRDIGIQLAGDLLKETLEYQVGIFNGNADGANTDGDLDDKKDIAARVFAKPFANSNHLSLQGIGLGVGGSIGDREGTAANSILNTGYTTPGQQTFFRYAANSFANGQQWRLSPQAYWYSGNKGLLAEYAISNVDVQNGATLRELEHKAWNVAASYVITGEDVTFSGVKPAADFNPSKGDYGAFEIIARAGQLDIDDDAFTSGLATLTNSATKATSYGSGLNWYLSDNLRIALNYNYTEFDGGAAAGADRPEEHAIFSRVQLRF